MDIRQTQVTRSEGAKGGRLGLADLLFDRLLSRRRRQMIACLGCSMERVVTADAGDCPACGYLGWKHAEPGARAAQSRAFVGQQGP